VLLQLGSKDVGFIMSSDVIIPTLAIDFKKVMAVSLPCCALYYFYKIRTKILELL
jgi:hypothetical protein